MQRFVNVLTINVAIMNYGCPSGCSRLSQDKEMALKNPIVPILMFVGVIVCTLGVIIAGYFHGHMHLLETLKNARAN